MQAQAAYNEGNGGMMECPHCNLEVHGKVAPSYLLSMFAPSPFSHKRDSKIIFVCEKCGGKWAADVQINITVFEKLESNNGTRI